MTPQVLDPPNLHTERRREDRRRYPAITDPHVMRAHQQFVLDVGQMLHGFRDRAGLSIERAAELAGMHPETVSGIENSRTDPATSSIVKLLAVYGFRPVLKAAVMAPPVKTGEIAEPDA